MDIADVSSRFEGRQRQCGEFIYVCCPVHKDQNPSCSIWRSPHDWICVRCWAGCQERDILQAIGLKKHDMGPPRENATPPVKRRIDETYDYQDEQGKLLYQEVRWNPKQFSLRRPDPRRPGSWDWTLGDVRRVLYRLPQLVLHPDWLVVVVEGPRKANAVNALGLRLVATCNAGGGDSGSGQGKWSDEFSATLRGRRVVVIPDRDRAGYRHGDFVSGSLLRHGVGSVRVVELLDLPWQETHGADIYDWLKGKSAADFMELLRPVTEWAPRK